MTFVYQYFGKIKLRHWTTSFLYHTHFAPTTFCRMCPGSSGVEQWTENPRVGGSNPPPGTTFLMLKYTKFSSHSLFLMSRF